MNQEIDEYNTYSSFEKDKCQMNPEEETLPTLGPYKYENSETYLGQYKNGLLYSLITHMCNFFCNEIG